MYVTNAGLSGLGVTQPRRKRLISQAQAIIGKIQLQTPTGAAPVYTLTSAQRKILSRAERRLGAGRSGSLPFTPFEQGILTGKTPVLAGKALTRYVQSADRAAGQTNIQTSMDAANAAYQAGKTTDTAGQTIVDSGGALPSGITPSGDGGLVQLPPGLKFEDAGSPDSTAGNSADTAWPSDVPQPGQAPAQDQAAAPSGFSLKSPVVLAGLALVGYFVLKKYRGRKKR